jgi:uncharacterized flavoprotein (TIGR03862 family)
MIDALVIGAGPAGLMAAQEMALAGRDVVVVEAKPSAGRKLLMAGKSGLNLTKDEAFAAFLARYGDSALRLQPMLENFSNTDVKDWANALGQQVFTGSSGRVFPKAMKASPLLRAWLHQLDGLGVGLRTRWRWNGWDGAALRFSTPEGERILTPKVTVLALGGGSWRRLGSDGEWMAWLGARGVATTDLAPANVGLNVDWSVHMTRHSGAPVKGVALIAGAVRDRGEFVISARGLEGGGIYAMTAPVRAGHDLFVDLMPDWDRARIAARLQTRRPKTTLSNHLRKALRLDPVKLALLMEFARPLPDAAALAALIKHLPIRHAGLRPLDEAISTAGGVAWDAVDGALMLRDIPGMFVAGEMLDWEAPTGGYLLNACLATGKWAGRAAADWRV